ncbi:MAG: Smr/MutS family protein [Alphaproteobacteria bacterium]|nr:Smr/MutS family protein [Alphaproteobacteria bacterium]
MAQDSDKELEDFLLWKSFTRDIEPIRNQDWEKEEEALIGRKATDKVPTIVERVVPEVEKSVKKQQAIFHQLDKRTEEKLKKGKIPIEGTLDLHGLNQSQAHSAVENAVLTAAKQHKRCLLIITGKGNTGKTGDDWLTPTSGVLKTRVPQWLSTPPMSYHVLRYVQAQPKHGGGGALYVYLRRNR